MSRWNDPFGNFDLKWFEDVKTGCWEWLASKDKDGYGIFTILGKKLPAHRASWRLYHTQGGQPIFEIPNDVEVLHKCNNTSCVNPDHLYLGTQKQNIQDQINAGTFVLGSSNGMAKLDEQKVRDIRASDRSNRELATLYGVSYYTIWDARNRRWKHVCA